MGLESGERGHGQIGTFDVHHIAFVQHKIVHHLQQIDSNDYRWVSEAHKKVSLFLPKVSIEAPFKT